MIETLHKVGIDVWGLLLYLINFGILFAILGKFLYRPILNFLDERRATIQKNLAEAELLRTQFQAEITKREQEVKATTVKMQEDLASMKSYAEQKSKEIIADAEAQKEAMIIDTRAQIAAMKKNIERDVEKDLLDRMEKTLIAVMQTKVPADTIKESVQSAWKDFKKS